MLRHTRVAGSAPDTEQLEDRVRSVQDIATAVSAAVETQPAGAGSQIVATAGWLMTRKLAQAGVRTRTCESALLATLLVHYTFTFGGALLIWGQCIFCGTTEALIDGLEGIAADTDGAELVASPFAIRAERSHNAGTSGRIASNCCKREDMLKQGRSGEYRRPIRREQGGPARAPPGHSRADLSLDSNDLSPAGLRRARQLKRLQQQNCASEGPRRNAGTRVGSYHGKSQERRPVSARVRRKVVNVL